MTEMARAAAVALTGLQGTAVTVEAAVSSQLPGIAIIGLPDTALAEAKLRVKVACAQAGMPLTKKFITVNLSPAALPKHGSCFDLAIAVACLAASGYIKNPAAREAAYIGELALDGQLRRPNGMLSLVRAAQQQGHTKALVPLEAAAEAALVSGIEIISVASLAEAAAWVDEKAGAGTVTTAPTSNSESTKFTGPDIKDILGQEEAIKAMLVAAAGRHHVSLMGPPGAGKTMLAEALPGFLPALDDTSALETSCINSLGNSPITELARIPPFIAPHHTASAAAIIGGGAGGQVKPGAITQANNGVLFLDEAPEFQRRVLDALRQPLETGKIRIDRMHAGATLPAKFQLVIAANPCPCGYAKTVEVGHICECPPATQRRYQQRISGPLKDRIDIHLFLRRVKTLETSSKHSNQTTAEAQKTILAARLQQQKRFRNCAWRYNSQAPGTWLRHHSNRPDPAALAVLDQALHNGALSLRGYDRVLRVAWTFADLEGKPKPERQEIAAALNFRASENT